MEVPEASFSNLMGSKNYTKLTRVTFYIILLQFYLPMQICLLSDEYHQVTQD
jgi:hypothetical protein